MTARRLRMKHLAPLIAAVAAAGPAFAQPSSAPAYPPFPAARTLTDIATWARRNSDLPIEAIVGVGRDSVFAVQRTSEPAPLGVRVLVRQEAIDPAFAERLGARSADMQADIDCEGRRVFQRGVDYYAGSNRQGLARQLGAARDWQPIPPDTFMDRVRAAVCDTASNAAAPTAAPVALRR